MNELLSKKGNKAAVNGRDKDGFTALHLGECFGGVGVLSCCRNGEDRQVTAAGANTQRTQRIAGSCSVCVPQRAFLEPSLPSFACERAQTVAGHARGISAAQA